MWLSISHIAGSQNLDADGTSRLLDPRGQWTLPDAIFHKLCSHFKFFPVVDAFASRLNNKLKRYYSYTPDPFSEVVDCFTVSWSGTNMYCYPPCSCLGKTLRKIILDVARVLIVAPFWPSQPWFPLLGSLLVSNPVLIPPPCPIFLPFSPQEEHPQKHKLTLFSAVISGMPCEQEKFQRTLSRFNCKDSVIPQNSHIQLQSPAGRTFVVKGKYVQCDLLSKM